MKKAWTFILGLISTSNTFANTVETTNKFISLNSKECINKNTRPQLFMFLELLEEYKQATGKEKEEIGRELRTIFFELNKTGCNITLGALGCNICPEEDEK